MKTPISLADTKSNKIQQDKVAMQEGIKAIIAIVPEQIKLFSIHAKVLKAKQEALIKEGFTEEQALEIVKTRPIFE